MHARRAAALFRSAICPTVGRVAARRRQEWKRKTSLLRILCGLLQPTGGEVRWQGEGIHSLAEDYRGRLLYLGHLNAVKEDLTVSENLRSACGIAGIAARPAELLAALDIVGLAGFAHSPARHLSQGQKRRVALARLALGSAAPLWILDEPFATLDARGVETVGRLIEEQLGRGHLVVLTTHQETSVSAKASVRIELGEIERAPC